MLCYILNDYQIPNCNKISHRHYLHIFPNIEWIGLGLLLENKEIFGNQELKLLKNLILVLWLYKMIYLVSNQIEAFDNEFIPITVENLKQINIK